MTAPLDLATLRAKAQAAADIPQDWYEADTFDRGPADGAFIAAASPTTVLALLDRLERAEREREEAADLLRANGGWLRERLERVTGAAEALLAVGIVATMCGSAEATQARLALRAALDDEAPR